MPLAVIRNTANGLFWLTGIVLSVYLGAAAFGFVRNSSEHYSNFILGTVIMSGLMSVQDHIDQRRGADARWFWPKLIFCICATVVAAVSAGYVRWHAVRLETVQPFFPAFDFNMGLVFIGSIMLLNWLHWGGLLTSIIVLSIVYFFYGHYIQYPLLAIPEYDPEFVMNYLGLGTNEGVFWFAREAADSIWYLVLFAGALFAVGMLRMIVEIGKWFGNRVAGGAAFPALIGSGIVAAIMGTAVSNVVLTGRFTIPLMKSKGYSPAMAAGIEATAGCAGQIMPPVLGLAAFIIASLLNMPYVDIALAALIPGLLYMTGVTSGVLVYARRHNLPRLEETIDRALILRLLPTFLASFGVVMYFLLSYYTPSYAGLMGVVVALLFGLFQGRYRTSLREWKDAFEDALRMSAILSLLLVAIGPLGQVFLTTNLSGRLGNIMLILLPDNDVILLIGAAVLALVLGMGLPTPVAYIVVALALVPFLQEFGVQPLMAHFFVFYFACYSALSPPVAVAALAAAKIADAREWDTAVNAMKLMLTTFVIPFAFVYYPSLMSFPHLTWEVVPPVFLVLVLQWTVSVACYGFFWRRISGLERWLFGAASVAGYAAIAGRTLWWNLLFAVTLAAAVAWVALRPARRIDADIGPVNLADR